jgi:hypothetical protein
VQIEDCGPIVRVPVPVSYVLAGYDFADIRATLNIKVIEFERVLYGQIGKDPGDVIKKRATLWQEPITGRYRTTYHFSAYRCKECNTLFIVSDFEGLRHGCTSKDTN